MKKLALLATLSGAAAFGLAIASAGAVPLGGAKGLATADTGLVEPVHGCHREVVPDRFGAHYHVGPRCRRIDVGESRPLYPDRYYDPYPRRRCYGVGPLRVCE